MLELDKYRARMVDSEDLVFVNKLRLSTHVQENVGSHLFTNDILQKNWLENVSKSTKDKYLIFETKIASNHLAKPEELWQKIGLIRLNDIDFINRSVCVGGDIGLEFIGKGHSKIMYQIICKICFEIWGMNRIWLLVLEGNIRAKNLYHKLNFYQEGIMRKAIFKNGKFEDYILMSMLEEDYYKNNNIYSSVAMV